MNKSNSINKIITTVIIAGYAFVNINMQINFFAGNNIFDKYQAAKSAEDAVLIAQNAYYTKTGFLLLLLILMTFRTNFYLAFALSFTVYTILMLIFFGTGTPILIYCLGSTLALLSYGYSWSKNRHL